MDSLSISLAILTTIVGTLVFFYILHRKDETMKDLQSLNKEIMVHGFWLDNNEHFSYRAVVGESKGEDDDDDINIFYYFDPSEPIIGKHNNEFYIHSYEEIK